MSSKIKTLVCLVILVNQSLGELSLGCGKHVPGNIQPGMPTPIQIQVQDPLMGKVYRDLRLYLPSRKEYTFCNIMFI